MGMRPVPIPGQILESEVILGLTFDELVLLGAVPLVVMLPSLFIEQIPTFVTLAIGVVMLLVMIGVALSTPEGQSPLEWAPAALQRRFGPTTYYLRPDESAYDRSTYLSKLEVLDDGDSGASDDGTGER
jgi:hypothetical protein